MKYLAILLMLTACSTARIVNSPPDGQHIPVTVECNFMGDCAKLLEQTCRHNHYKIQEVTAIRGEKQDTYRVKVQCNP